MASNISQSLAQLKQILDNSNNKITDFRNTNREFRKNLIDKIKSILNTIQNLATNPNIKNLTVQLQQSQTQLESLQQQLQESNAQLNNLQQQMQQLQKEKADLLQKMQTSGDESGKLQQQMQQLQQQLNECLASQNQNIDTIAQVNDLLTKQVDNMNGMLQESNSFNTEYDAEISAIATNLQLVVNMLNGTAGPGPSSGSEPGIPPPPGLGPSRRRIPPTTGNVSDVYNDYENMGRGGKKRRRTHKKIYKRYTKKMKGGYNWSSLLSSSSNSNSNLNSNSNSNSKSKTSYNSKTNKKNKSHKNVAQGRGRGK